MFVETANQAIRAVGSELGNLDPTLPLVAVLKPSGQIGRVLISELIGPTANKNGSNEAVSWLSRTDVRLDLPNDESEREQCQIRVLTDFFESKSSRSSST